MASLFAPARLAVTPGPSTTCRIFAWIGQSWESCVECGRPDREHPYRPVYGGGRPDLYVKHYRRYLKRWEWQPVIVKPGDGRD